MLGLFDTYTSNSTGTTMASKLGDCCRIHHTCFYAESYQRKIEIGIRLSQHRWIDCLLVDFVGEVGPRTRCFVDWLWRPCSFERRNDRLFAYGFYFE